MLSIKGTYQVKETNLFSAEPIVQKRKMQINQRQKVSPNGYANPRLQDSETNLQMRSTPIRHVRQVRRHGYYTQQTGSNPQQYKTEIHQKRGLQHKHSFSHAEMQRMKLNHFIEAKNIMFVFDEILRNANATSDLEGSPN